jgi:hypothetical protein
MLKHVPTVALLSLFGLVLFMVLGYFTGTLAMLMPVLAVATMIIAASLLSIVGVFHLKARRGQISPDFFGEERHASHHAHHEPAHHHAQFHEHVDNPHAHHEGHHEEHHEAHHPHEEHHAVVHEEPAHKHVFQHEQGVSHHFAEDPAHQAQQYISKMRSAGASDEQIKERLMSVGWDSLAVDMELMKK